MKMKVRMKIEKNKKSIKKELLEEKRQKINTIYSNRQQKSTNIDWDNPNYEKHVVSVLQKIKISGHQEQINAAIKIILSWTDVSSSRNHYSILWSKTQAGKTGVLIALVNILRKSGLDKFFEIDKYYFICGMNVNNLHLQTGLRVIDGVNDVSYKDIIFSTKENYSGFQQNAIEQITNKQDAFIYVLKNSDLKSINQSNITNISFNNSLILMDEVQYGQNEENVLTEFIENGGVDYKNRTDLFDNKIYMVAVSATPYDEIFSDTIGSKNIIELQVTQGKIGSNISGYIGHADFFMNNQIYNATGRIEEIRDALEDAYQRIIKDNRPGICYIRTSEKIMSELSNDIDIQNKFNCVEINCKGGKIDYEKITDKFELLITAELMGNPLNQKPIILFIKGAYNAGDTLTEGHDKRSNLLNKNIKDYIYLVYDFTKGKVETTIQRMSGRMSGYRKDCQYAGITKLYVNEEHILDHIAHELEPSNRLFVPGTKSQNIEISCGEDGSLRDKYYNRIKVPISNIEANKLKQESKLNPQSGRNIIDKWLKTNLNKISNLYFDFFCEVFIAGEENYEVRTREWLDEQYHKITLERTNKNAKRRAFYSNFEYIEHRDVTPGSKLLQVALIGNDGVGYTLRFDVGEAYLSKTIRTRDIKEHKNTDISEPLKISEVILPNNR